MLSGGHLERPVCSDSSWDPFVFGDKGCSFPLPIIGHLSHEGLTTCYGGRGWSE